jgi:hypothetical protein
MDLLALPLRSLALPLLPPLPIQFSPLTLGAPNHAPSHSQEIITNLLLELAGIQLLMVQTVHPPAMAMVDSLELPLNWNADEAY